jgi:hypothetical protein
MPISDLKNLGLLRFSLPPTCLYQAERQCSPGLNRRNFPQFAMLETSTIQNFNNSKPLAFLKHPGIMGKDSRAWLILLQSQCHHLSYAGRKAAGSRS